MLTDRYVIRAGIHIADLGAQGMVLLDLVRDEYLGADLIAAEIIRQIVGNGTMEDVAKNIAEEYGVQHDVVSRDIEEFLTRWIEEGVVGGGGGGGGRGGRGGGGL
jgi:hypothetical protein